MTNVAEQAAVKKSEVGRPRSGTPQRPDLSPADQILDAAARLFVERGYAATSTRAIADEVGIRQASLYYYFSNKESLLNALLLRTVEPSLTMATRLAGTPGPAAPRLFALIAYDVDQLVRAAHNVGTLYLLPEVRIGQFERFRDERLRLKQVYASLVGSSLTEDTGGPTSMLRVDGGEHLADIVFGLVESAIAIRADHAADDLQDLSELVAGSGLHVLGFDVAAVAEVAETGRTLLARLVAEGPAEGR